MINNPKLELEKAKIASPLLHTLFQKYIKPMTATDKQTLFTELLEHLKKSIIVRIRAYLNEKFSTIADPALKATIIGNTINNLFWLLITQPVSGHDLKPEGTLAELWKFDEHLAWRALSLLLLKNNPTKIDSLSTSDFFLVIMYAIKDSSKGSQEKYNSSFLKLSQYLIHALRYGNSPKDTNLQNRAMPLDKISDHFLKLLNEICGVTVPAKQPAPMIFSSPQDSSLSEEGLFEKLGERKNSGEVDRVAKLMAEQHLAGFGWAFGKAIGNGDCFFDSVAKGLKKINNNMLDIFAGDTDYKKLRMICKKYAVDQHTNNDHWLKIQLNKEHQEYLMGIAYTAAEIEAMYKAQTYHSSAAVWGRTDIDGRIICEVLKVKLLVLELYIVDNAVMHMYQFTDANGSKTITTEEEIKALYEEQNVVHLAAYQHSLHFVPVFKRDVEQNPAVIPGGQNPLASVAMKDIGPSPK